MKTISFSAERLQKMLRPGVILLVVAFAFFEAQAQQTPVPPSRIVLKDTIDFGDGAKSGLINKIIQPIRFRDNNIRRERERMVSLIRRLTNEGDMGIDSATVDSIVDDLLTLTEGLAATQDTTVRLQDEINQTILDLNTKASRQLVDSIQVQLGNVLQGLLDDSKAENIATRKQLAAKLTSLRQVQFSCGSTELPLLQATLGDTLHVSYHQCLSAQTRIFGWHQAEMGDKYQNYNLNYLTDLILYGYELSAGGKENNSKALQSLLEGGIVEKNESYGKALSLAVYSNSAPVVSTFLNQESAQDQFITRLGELIPMYGLKGVNISFTEIQSKDSKKFSEFVYLLRTELNKIDQELLLTVGIPSIANSKAIASANAYDFLVLNPLVDYYLVQTQTLNITGTRIPFSASPLYPDQSQTRGSIEGTFSFYSNGKIPIGKLILTVSYQGISWPMPDFVPGSRALNFGTVMDYATIQKTLIPTVGQLDGAVLGYDPEQAAAYLNYGAVGDLRQVWYEDSKSLVEKYIWTLENSAGGVAIWGLGYDEGYTELWDALGATLIRVDSVVVSTESLVPSTPSVALDLMDYLRIYMEDVKWAGLNDIYIGDPNKREPNYCFFEVYPDPDSIQHLAKTYKIESFWQNLSPFVHYPNTEYYSVDSYEDCVCMLGRWDRYTEINGLVALILFATLLMGVMVTMLGIRKHGDEWKLRGLFIGISIAIGLLALVATFFYLFFNTEVGFIGAGSSEVTIWALIMIFTLGIVAGLIINRLRLSKRFVYRELP